MSGARTVLYFSDLSVIGGGEGAMLALVQTLDRARFRPVVMAPAEGPLTAAMAVAGAHCVVAKLHEAMRYWRIRRWWPPRRLGLRRGLATLARTLVDEGIDLIHTHGGMYPENMEHLGRAARAAGIPVVWDCGYGGMYPPAVFARCMTPWVDRVIAVSGSVRDMLLTAGWPDPARIDVFYNGLDFGSWRPDASRRESVRRELGAGPGDVLFGMVGRVIPLKGHDVFFEAARRMIREGTGGRFVVVGDQRPDEGSRGRYFNALVEEVRSTELRGRMVMAGWRDDIPEVMDALDCLVQPSRVEAFGRTLVEAMALAKPVVATRVGGMREIIAHGESGFLVPPHDPATLAATMTALAGDGSLRARVGARARESVVPRFDLTRRTRKVEALYDAVLNREASQAVIAPERLSRRAG